MITVESGRDLEVQDSFGDMVKADGFFFVRQESIVRKLMLFRTVSVHLGQPL